MDKYKLIMTLLVILEAIPLSTDAKIDPSHYEKEIDAPVFFDEDDAEDAEFFDEPEGPEIRLRGGQDEDVSLFGKNQVHLDIEPTAIVNRSVNAITGQYMDGEIDFVISGAEPFLLQRNYVSGGNNPWSPFGKSWSHNYFAYIERGKDEDRHKKYLATVFDAGGSIYEYGYHSNHNYKMFPSTYEKGVTNCPCGFMSKHTNIKTNALEYQEDGNSILRKCSGENLTLTHYMDGEYSRLTREEKPNGNYLQYFYNDDNNRLAKIKAFGCRGNLLDILDFSYDESKTHIFITNGNQDKATYSLKYISGLNRGGRYIVRAALKNRPSIEYAYEDESDDALSPKIIRKKLPESRFQEIEYYKKGKNYFDNGFKHIDIKHAKDRRNERVKLQKAPVGTDKTPIVTHTYIYSMGSAKNGGVTRVFDAYKNYTDYCWDQNLRLTAVKRYPTPRLSIHPYSEENLYWGELDTDQSTFLLARTCKNMEGKIEFMRTFKYDRYGNVLVDALYGNLSGKNQAPCRITNKGTTIETGCEKYEKHFSYYPDGQNMLTMTEDGVTQTFEYKEGTNLLKAKLHSYQDKIFKRQFYVFDDNAVLIQEIEDDGTSTSKKNLAGATERHIRSITPRKTKPIGLPEVIEDKYLDLESGKEHLIQKSVHKYCEEGRLRAKKLYDANGKHICTLTWDYDAYGNVTLETNALGQKTVRQYDENNNKVYEKGPATNVHKEFIYDYSNRLIRIDEIHEDGLCLSESYKYNYLNQKISSTDIYGNETIYNYDEFGRQTKTILPAIINDKGALKSPEDSKEYNIFNAPQSCTDCKGNRISIETTIRGKPTSTIYPDGTSEEIEYNLNDTVKKQTHRNGSSTHYEYDHLKRLTKKSTYDHDNIELETLSYAYNTFHLLSETDAAGNIKNYKYGFDGRLKEITKGDNRTTYAYNAMGHLWKTTEHNGLESSVNYIQEFDLLDRVIEERQEDSKGNVLTKVTYEYDRNGNRKYVFTYSDKGKATTTTIYDPRHQPVRVTDPSGNVTHIAYKYDYTNEYGQIVPYSVSTDPMGNITENIKDTHGRLVCLIQKNSMGDQLHKKCIFYDLNGNKSRQEDYATEVPGQTKEPITTLWTYDGMNRLTGAVEAAGCTEQKQMEIGYNQYGEKSEVIKPDNVRIEYKYNALGRLKSQASSDKSIDYRFKYDANGNIKRVKDKINRLQTIRKYDAMDRLKQETLANGLSVTYTYDSLNQPRNITFPDNSGVEYVYNGKRLMEVHRLSQEKELLYTHRYVAYDLQDKLTVSELIGKAGKASYSYDRMGRAVNLHYDSWDETITSYDNAGNLTDLKIKEPKHVTKCHYTYDELYQVIEEDGLAKHSYGCDSLNNRIRRNGKKLTVNGLNQLLEDARAYDPNGNLKQKTTSEGTIFFEYDALDRLVAVVSGNKRFCYTYDAQNRRLIKKSGTRKGKNAPWQYENAMNFLYLGQNEVGSYDHKGHAHELRLLGLSRGAEIGAAIAVELQGQVYAPLHDHIGNVTALVDAKTGRACEYYRYTAFGEEILLNAEGIAIAASLNPWRFSSKRIDTETGLIYFGRRYYEPATGRWITPDPIGQKDGQNVYAFVHNRPLTSFDMYGLWATGQNPFYNFGWELGNIVQTSVQFAGTYLTAAAFHFVPIPFAREALQLIGCTMSGKGFGDIHFMFMGKNECGDLDLPERERGQDGIAHIHSETGGICTSGADMRVRAAARSAAHGGCNVHWFAFASDGALLDLTKAAIRSFGIPLPGDHEYADFHKKISDDNGGPENCIVHAKAHSQGAIVTDNLRSQLGAKYCKSIDAYTIGGGRILDKRNFYDAFNFVSPRDPVPILGHPTQYISAAFRQRSDFIFLETKGLPILDHMFDGKAYQSANSYANEMIQHKLQSD